ncbi:MAG TPA: succinate dehydrogenase assembly factor 2 [Steroidobacteraceae bacterium]
MAAMRESPTRSELAWRCRRGTRELDLLLLGWLDRRFEGASEEERAGFAALLALPDPQLMRQLLAGEAGLGTPLAAAARAVTEATAGAAAQGRPTAPSAAQEGVPAASRGAQPPLSVEPSARSCI